MARGHDLRVARAAGAPVVTIAACSGHAFKFGPLLGRMAADLALAR
jgi:glycine/D-amino acid oxidase-like deaminating enzyme